MLPLPNLLARRVLAGLGMAVLILLSFVALRWGLADIYAARGRSLLVEWESASAEPAGEARDRASLAFRRAMALHPGHPDLAEAMGRVLAWGVMEAPTGDARAARARQSALALYREAVRQRPVWPMTWANLALVKYQLGEMDQELEHALLRATELGPWEPGVQSVVAVAGMGAWNHVSRKTRAAVYANGVRGLARNPRSMLETAEASGLLRVFCYTLPDDAVVQRFCDQSAGRARAG